MPDKSVILRKASIFIAYPANSVGKTNELDDCGRVATVEHNSMDNAVKKLFDSNA